MRPSAEHILP